MIKFFRNIRKNLLNEGKTTKYFKYAIGEIVLVVIGILIALQINNWNEDRKDRIQEQKILMQLRDEFKANIAQLENKINLREYVMQKASEVLTYIDLQQDVPIDTLMLQISPILLAPTFDPIQNEILNSENLQLIKNDSLRSYLSKWPSGIVDLKEQENEYRFLYNNTISPLLIDMGISRDVNIAFYKDPKNLNYMMDKSNFQNINLQKSKRMPSSKSILNNIKLEGVLSSAVIINAGVNAESESHKKQMQKILNLIESDIK
jgi:hypothetical protein